MVPLNPLVSALTLLQAKLTTAAITTPALRAEAANTPAEIRGKAELRNKKRRLWYALPLVLVPPKGFEPLSRA